MTSTSESTSAERTAPVTSASEQPEGAEQERPHTEVRPDRRRRCALGLEIEELASLVAAVGDDAEEQPEQRERERERRGGAERGERAAGERVGPRASRAAPRARSR